MNAQNSRLDPPPEMPRDIRLGLTKAKDVAFPLRWGLIGAGNICRQWAEVLKACEGATLSAVASRSIEKARDFARQHGIAQFYNDYAELVNSADVDVVYVGTPDRLHKEHCLLALNAGKHVLCEKDIAQSVVDAEEMYAAAKTNNVMLQDGVWTRFFPAVEHARMLLESGAIGDVVTVQSDLNPLYTSQAVTLGFGSDKPPLKVTAFGNLPTEGGGAGCALMDFGGNKYAILTFVEFGSEFREVTEIIGTHGRLTLEDPGHCPTILTVRTPSTVPYRYLHSNAPSPSQRFEYPIPDIVRMPDAYPNQQGFLYQAEAIHRCIAAGLDQCPQFTMQESLHTLSLLTQINAAKKRAM
jgi:dihydrodiol dehydrogenase / D-xylose 1-dehydrogenase (NADP)